MKPDIYWIAGPWRGKLAIRARPRGDDWLEDEVQGWKKAGVDAACVLVTSGESPQSAFEHIERARGRSVPDTAEQKQWEILFARDLVTD